MEFGQNAAVHCIQREVKGETCLAFPLVLATPLVAIFPEAMQKSEPFHPPKWPRKISRGSQGVHRYPAQLKETLLRTHQNHSWAELCSSRQKLITLRTLVGDRRPSDPQEKRCRYWSTPKSSCPWSFPRTSKIHPLTAGHPSMLGYNLHVRYHNSCVPIHHFGDFDGSQFWATWLRIGQHVSFTRGLERQHTTRPSSLIKSALKLNHQDDPWDWIYIYIYTSNRDAHFMIFPIEIAVWENPPLLH